MYKQIIKYSGWYFNFQNLIVWTLECFVCVVLTVSLDSKTRFNMTFGSLKIALALFKCCISSVQYVYIGTYIIQIWWLCLLHMDFLHKLAQWTTRVLVQNCYNMNFKFWTYLFFTNLESQTLEILLQ